MGVYKSKDRRGKERVYVEKRWPRGAGRFKRVVPNRTMGKKLLARIEESIAMVTWRELKEELSRDRQQPVTIADLSMEYLEYCQVRNRCPDFKERKVKTIVSMLGSISVADFTRADANQFMKVHARSRSPATVNRSLAVLKHMFTFALQQGFIETHPLVRFALLPEPQKALRVLALEEERRLVDCVVRYDPGVGAYVAVLGETGIRKSEGLRLQWSDVDFGNRLLSVGETKNGKARYIPLTDYAIEWLGGSVRMIGNPRVFLQPNGKPWRDPRGPFKSGARDADLEWVKGFHDLRHFRATQWVKHGVDLRTVKELLGHSSIETTMRYAHFAPNHAARSVHESEVSERAELESKRHDSGMTVETV